MQWTAGRPGRYGAIVTILVLLLATASAGGCASSAAKTATDPLDTVATANLTQMTPSEKKGLIAPSFPVQVPVAKGIVQKGEAQSAGAWDYVVIVPGEVYSVERWYLRTYVDSEWTVVSRQATELSLQKNNAQSRIEFEKVAGSPGQTKVTAAVGVGTQVLGTQ